jgi:hypothetical protein
LTDEKRLKKAVFYLDESICSRVLLSAMEAACANVRRVGLDVPFGSPDDVWLRIVGKNNWIVLMRDQRVRRRRLEIETLKAHRVAAFAFTGGQETAQQTAQTICPLLMKFATMHVSEPKPFLYTFGCVGLIDESAALGDGRLCARNTTSNQQRSPQPSHVRDPVGNTTHGVPQKCWLRLYYRCNPGSH